MQIAVVSDFSHLLKDAIHNWVKTLHDIKSFLQVLDNWNLVSDIRHPHGDILDLIWISRLFLLLLHILC